ncbi:MAG: hypothetical protein OK438_02780 [Thaumarchaeota archaeon]|nr:hypothetical protein [Nitrososphaerota archaeon]
MRESRTLVLIWFAVVGLITLAIVPIRLYVLSANDWLVGAPSTLALVFFVIYFLVAWLWKPKTVTTPSVDAPRSG